jgi:hypothetical protein
MKNHREEFFSIRFSQVQRGATFLQALVFHLEAVRDGSEFRRKKCVNDCRKKDDRGHKIKGISLNAPEKLLRDTTHLAIRIDFEWCRKVHGLFTRDCRWQAARHQNPCNQDCGKNSARGAYWL